MTSSVTELQPELLRGTWVIDTKHSTLAFSAWHAMVATVRGRFSEFSGSITIDPDDPSKATAEARALARRSGPWL